MCVAEDFWYMVENWGKEHAHVSAPQNHFLSSFKKSTLRMEDAGFHFFNSKIFTRGPQNIVLYFSIL